MTSFNSTFFILNFLVELEALQHDRSFSIWVNGFDFLMGSASSKTVRKTLFLKFLVRGFAWHNDRSNQTRLCIESVLLSFCSYCLSLRFLTEIIIFEITKVIKHTMQHVVFLFFGDKNSIPTRSNSKNTWTWVIYLEMF